MPNQETEEDDRRLLATFDAMRNLHDRNVKRLEERLLNAQNRCSAMKLDLEAVIGNQRTEIAQLRRIADERTSRILALELAANAASAALDKERTLHGATLIHRDQLLDQVSRAGGKFTNRAAQEDALSRKLVEAETKLFVTLQENEQLRGASERAAKAQTELSQLKTAIEKDQAELVRQRATNASWREENAKLVEVIKTNRPGKVSQLRVDIITLGRDAGSYDVTLECGSTILVRKDEVDAELAKG